MIDNSTIRQKIKVFELPEGFSFYEKASSPLISQLLDLADKASLQEFSEVKAILLQQTGNATDITPNWQRELAEETLLDHLVDQMKSFRTLLDAVRDSNILWLYAARGNCFGSHFELAMSCHRRLWFSKTSEIGFPDIASGAFPPAGTLELLNSLTSKTRDRWRNRPVIDTGFAQVKGRIDFAANASKWQDLSRDVAAEFLRSLTNEEPRKKREKEKEKEKEYLVEKKSEESGEKSEIDNLDSRPFREIDKESSEHSAESTDGNAANVVDEMEAFARDTLAKAADAPSAWECCWHLIRRNAKLFKSENLQHFLCYFSARHYLSPRYNHWANAQLIRPQRPSNSDSIALPVIFIDLDFLAPPTSALITLLHHGTNVVFVAAESKNLCSSIDLVYSRLERNVGAQKATQLWQLLVTWYQGAGFHSDFNGCVLRWSVDDRLHIHHGGQTLQILRLEGNGREAPSGLCEYAYDKGEKTEADPTALSVATLLSDTLVTTSPIEARARPYSTTGETASVPVGIFVRWIFFREMLRVASFRDGDLQSVAVALKTSEWKFASEEEAWDRFLKTHGDDPRFASIMNEMMPPCADMKVEMGEMGTWKSARNILKKRSKKESRWNDTATSLHLATFTGLIAEWLQHKSLVQAHLANALVAEALGFPALYGTPQTFLRERGERRIRSYAAEFWPSMETTWFQEQPLCTP